MWTEEQITDQTLLEENTSLKNQIQELTEKNHQLEVLATNLVEHNKTLSEFIRLRMSDILRLAEQFRDEYTKYAEFMKALFPGEPDVSEKREVPVQLGDD